MSVAASRYALRTLAADPDLPGGARNLFQALAAAAGHKTAATYTGKWLRDVSGLGDDAVYRNLKILVERGYITVDRRPGIASRVRFPIAGAVVEALPSTATGRLDDSGAFHPDYCACPDCLELQGTGTSADSAFTLRPRTRTPSVSMKK